MNYTNSERKNICESIIKDLKALEIIKENNVNIRLIKLCNTVVAYNESVKYEYDVGMLSTQDFELVKEVMSND